MDRACDNCKFSKEQKYTGYFKPLSVHCRHPEEHRNYMPERDYYCEKWEGDGE